MNIIPFYFFMTLFIGFFLIYVLGNDYYVIIKNKSKSENYKSDCINCHK